MVSGVSSMPELPADVAALRRLLMTQHVTIQELLTLMQRYLTDDAKRLTVLEAQILQLTSFMGETKRTVDALERMERQRQQLLQLREGQR